MPSGTTGLFKKRPNLEAYGFRTFSLQLEIEWLIIVSLKTKYWWKVNLIKKNWTWRNIYVPTNMRCKRMWGVEKTSDLQREHREPFRQNYPENPTSFISWWMTGPDQFFTTKMNCKLAPGWSVSLIYLHFGRVLNTLKTVLCYLLCIPGSATQSTVQYFRENVIHGLSFSATGTHLVLANKYLLVCTCKASASVLLSTSTHLSTWAN